MLRIVAVMIGGAAVRGRAQSGCAPALRWKPVEAGNTPRQPFGVKIKTINAYARRTGQGKLRLAWGDGPT